MLSIHLFVLPATQAPFLRSLGLHRLARVLTVLLEHILLSLETRRLTSVLIVLPVNTQMCSGQHLPMHAHHVLLAHTV